MLIEIANAQEERLYATRKSNQSGNAVKMNAMERRFTPTAIESPREMIFLSLPIFNALKHATTNAPLITTRSTEAHPSTTSSAHVLQSAEREFFRGVENE